MSRSCKKSPFTRFTTALSDQPWKAKASRAFRQSAKQALGGDADGSGLPVKRWAVVNPWDAPKDGKQRARDARWKWLRK